MQIERCNCDRQRYLPEKKKCFFGIGPKNLTAVSTDGGKNMHMYVQGWRCRTNLPRAVRMKSDIPMVFRRVIHHETLRCKFFALPMAKIINTVTSTAD